jgi:hypothetical protein
MARTEGSTRGRVRGRGRGRGGDQDTSSEASTQRVETAPVVPLLLTQQKDHKLQALKDGQTVSQMVIRHSHK